MIHLISLVTIIKRIKTNKTSNKDCHKTSRISIQVLDSVLDKKWWINSWNKFKDHTRLLLAKDNILIKIKLLWKSLMLIIKQKEFKCYMIQFWIVIMIIKLIHTMSLRTDFNILINIIKFYMKVNKI